MVKLHRNSDLQNSQEFVSFGILSIGLISLVVSLFLGIKFKWFRYRLDLPTINDDEQQEHSVVLRSHSVTEIRENCSVGIYRKSSPEELLIRSDNEINSTSIKSPSSHNGKSKSSDRESIFRWPFRNKLSLTRGTLREENMSKETGVSSTGTLLKQFERRETDPTLVEKNERLRRSIYERLNSSSSMSMPDLVQSESSNIMKKEASQSIDLTLHESTQVSLEEISHSIVDEIRENKALKTIFVNPKDNSSDKIVSEISREDKELPKIEIEKDIEEEELEIPPRPPTPIRRRSRSNSLKPLETTQNNQIVQDVPPIIIPRKKNINYNKNFNNHENIQPTDNKNDYEIVAAKEILKHEEDSNQMTPKSILKSNEQQEHTTHQTKVNVHFINVPDSSSDDEYDDSIEIDNSDVWRKIDIHREQLMKKYEVSNYSPPPLPKTPPPSASDSQQRDFQFA